ncbi:apiosidase-like domain-containing protein [Bradyrhizobium sp. UFLA05-112]
MLRSVARALLGGALFIGPMPCLLAQEAPMYPPISGSGSPGGPVYPLKASRNNRYLVDQKNTPFLMVGDSPQQLITSLSQSEAAAFMVNRRSYGINTLWINLLCIFTEASCNIEAKTFDGIAPFLVPGDLATPNPAYFQRVDDMLRIAADHGTVVLLDPIETISWLDFLRKNGKSKAFAYGQYLGSRYKDFPNLVWMHGNDLQSWQNAADDDLVKAVARGIRSIDKNHIHTVELNYTTSGSLDDDSWAPLIELDAAYTYFPTYAQVLTEYNRANFKPVFMVEANYEFEGQLTGDSSTRNLRQQEYWSMLSGAAGQLYGSAHSWQLRKGWEAKLDTSGVIQLSHMEKLFASRRWYDLVPDQTHAVVTAGYDYFSCAVGKFMAYAGHDQDSLMSRALGRFRKYWGIGYITSNTCATAARTPNGSLVIVYMPSIRTITVDMSRLAGTATARWYDPTSGEYTDVTGSPFANEGSRRFTPSGVNKSGEGDWVLVLEASPPP